MNQSFPSHIAARTTANPTPPLLAVDGQRLWQSLMSLAQLGATPKGGVCRLALSELDRQARDLFVRWAQEAGCTVRVDRKSVV